jgi:tetratricopeptide (TPR) repeat protein
VSVADRLGTALALKDFDRAADVAVEIGPSAAIQLPAGMRLAFDAISDAFLGYEAGDDDAARERLRTISLSSPFLDWKLLIRGLIAHATGDSARALDNWSRLAVGRLAGKLVAPLRFALDPIFRAAQPPPEQANLGRQGDRLVGGLGPAMRQLQRLLARERLDDAFRHAAALLPSVKREWPEAVDRLADCVRSAIISHGDALDLERYSRLFGRPADDPTLERLEALMHEEQQLMPFANAAWQRFQQSMVDNTAWSPVDRDRARALVWSRMGRNAEKFENSRQRFGPDAEECYKHAARLAPDLAEPQERLYRKLYHEKRFTAALSVGKRFIEQFPNRADALAAMAVLCNEKGRSADAIDYSRRALAVNPLDRSLREMTAAIHRSRARSLASVGNDSASRAELAEALRLTEGPPDVNLLAIAAAVALKSGERSAADAYVGQMPASAGPAVAYALLVEAIRLKLPRSLKQRFEIDFTAALSIAPTGTAAATLASVFQMQAEEGEYTGVKGHEKRVRSFVEAALKADTAETPLIAVCERLRDLGWLPTLKKAAVAGQRRFPRSPFFPYFVAISYLAKENPAHGRLAWKAEPLLEKSRRLATGCPPSERLESMLREIDVMRRRVGVPPPFAHALNELLDFFSED